MPRRSPKVRKRPHRPVCIIKGSPTEGRMNDLNQDGRMRMWRFQNLTDRFGRLPHFSKERRLRRLKSIGPLQKSPVPKVRRRSVQGRRVIPLSGASKGGTGAHNTLHNPCQAPADGML